MRHTSQARNPQPPGQLANPAAQAAQAYCLQLSHASAHCSHMAAGWASSQKLRRCGAGRGGAGQGAGGWAAAALLPAGLGRAEQRPGQA